MAWYVSFDKLGQKQHDILKEIEDDLDSRHWIQGFAGTGKTLVLTHLMERIARLKPSVSLCFVTYTHALKDMVSSGMRQDVVDRVAVMTHKQFLRDRRNYDYVFLDEVQDISPLDLQKLVEMASHLVVAGDQDQRIYPDGAKGEEVREIVRPKEWRLVEVFRLTKKLQRVAQAILPQTRLIEGLHSSRTAEVTIRLLRHGDLHGEALWNWNEAKRRSLPGSPSVILFPRHKDIARFASQVATALGYPKPPAALRPNYGSMDYSEFNDFWAQKKADVMYFGSKNGELGRGEKSPMVYLMTFHGSKGLDFKNVFIPGMCEGVSIVAARAIAQNPDLDRRLLFVAVTRSRENLFLSYVGSKAVSLLDMIPPDVLVRSDAVPADASKPEEFF